MSPRKNPFYVESTHSLFFPAAASGPVTHLQVDLGVCNINLMQKCSSTKVDFVCSLLNSGARNLEKNGN